MWWRGGSAASIPTVCRLSPSKALCVYFIRRIVMAMSPRYLAYVVPGLESLAKEELKTGLHSSEVLRVLQHLDERNSLIVFRCSDPASELLHLRLAEDVFVELVEADGVPTNRPGLAHIRSAIALSQSFDDAVAVVASVRPGRKLRKATFRVVARKTGDHAFRRVDVQRVVESGIHQRFPRWRLVEEDAQFEVWVTLVGRFLIGGLRLSGIEMRQRAYKRVSLPASLKPTIAHAMVLLSEPRPDDVFLDPMCGAGTIVIERAEVSRYKQLICGDIAPTAVEAVRVNVGRRYKPIEIRQWDARNLALEGHSVSAIVTNMPFGKQIGTHQRNQDLYPGLLREWARVLADSGRMVLLTGEGRLLRGLPVVQADLQLTREVPVIVRGLRASIYVLRKG